MHGPPSGRACLCLVVLYLTGTSLADPDAPFPGAPAESAPSTGTSTSNIRGAPFQSSQTSPQDVGWTWPSWGDPWGTGGSTAQPTSINYSNYTREHGTSTTSASEFPACSIQAALNEDGLICLAGSLWLALTQTLPPQLGWGSKIRPPVDPLKELPQPLKVLSMPLPALVPTEKVEAEKPTYYFLYRAIQNLYAAVGANARSRGTDSAQEPMLNLALPPAWTNQREYTLRWTGSLVAGVLQPQAPFAVSFTRDKEMLVVVRGTIYSAEWQRNFQYQHADPTETAAYRMPGGVHAGFFAVFKDLAEALIDDEIKRRAPSKVTFTGHSLGGSVGALLAFYTTHVLPRTQVELVSFGAPNVGDATFSSAFNARVRNRHLAFSGVGSEGDSYFIGDWISQVPCGAVTTCPLLSEMSSVDLNGSPSGQRQANESYSYMALGGSVPFTPAQMQNGRTWALRSDVTGFRYSPVAAHTCSYMCFTAPSVGDAYDQCVFTLELGSSVDMDKRCAINL